MARVITEKTLHAWLRAAPTDRSIGDGLTFYATASSAATGKASWILRYRFHGKQSEEVIGRYPDISLKEARELARRQRGRIQQGIDIGAEKRDARLKEMEQGTVSSLAHAWYDRHISNVYKHPEVVLRVVRRHIEPVIGTLHIKHVRPAHIDKVLTKVVNANAPTIANDVLRYLFRMFHFALKRRWIETNPVSGFDISDAGGREISRQRWLNRDELGELAKAMWETPNFGRENELAVWLLLALCVRKMELLSAKWSEFDLKRGVWTLQPSRTKTQNSIDIPLASQVLKWLEDVKVFSFNSEYLFPARRRIRVKNGESRKNRFDHVCPDTLNVALRRLPLGDMEHFTVHDMRRTARTHLAALGVDRFVAERALNHKVHSVEGVYNQYDYFVERREALNQWASVLESIMLCHNTDENEARAFTPLTVSRQPEHFAG